MVSELEAGKAQNVTFATPTNRSSHWKIRPEQKPAVFDTFVSQ